MKDLKTFDEFLNESINEGVNFASMASELVEIASAYVEIDMTPEMHTAQAVEDQDQLEEFYLELIDTVAEDANSSDITKFKKEASAFLLKKAKLKV